MCRTFILQTARRAPTTKRTNAPRNGERWVLPIVSWPSETEANFWSTSIMLSCQQLYFPGVSKVVRFLWEVQGPRCTCTSACSRVHFEAKAETTSFHSPSFAFDSLCKNSRVSETHKAPFFLLSFFFFSFLHHSDEVHTFLTTLFLYACSAVRSTWPPSVNFRSAPRDDFTTPATSRHQRLHDDRRRFQQTPGNA